MKQLECICIKTDENLSMLVFGRRYTYERRGLKHTGLYIITDRDGKIVFRCGRKLFITYFEEVK